MQKHQGYTKGKKGEIRVRLQRGENQPQARIIFPRPYAREADHLKPAYPAPKSNL